MVESLAYVLRYIILDKLIKLYKLFNESTFIKLDKIIYLFDQLSLIFISILNIRF